MADSQAQSIVDQALALAKTHPHASALDVLDLAMEGRHDADPDFEAPPGLPFADWTGPGSPFGAMLMNAFAASEVAPEALAALETADADDVLGGAWEDLVMPRFAARYRLWGQ